MMVCRSASSSSLYPTQSRNPYATDYSPTTVYIGGGGGTAAAPATGTKGQSFPPAAAAPAPAPQASQLVALGPLGPAAAIAAQNTSFGETQFSGVGPIYKKQDSLGPVRSHLNLQPPSVSVSNEEERVCFHAGSAGQGTTPSAECSRVVSS